MNSVNFTLLNLSGMGMGDGMGMGRGGRYGMRGGGMGTMGEYESQTGHCVHMRGLPFAAIENDILNVSICSYAGVL